MELHKITKQVEADLREIADTLPEIPVSTKKRVKGSDLPADLVAKQNTPIDSNAYYILHSAGSPQLVSHYKRLRSAYLQSGWPGVSVYVDPFRKKPKAQSHEPEQQN